MPSPSTRRATRPNTGRSTTNATTAVRTLKRTCATAVRFAGTLAPIAATPAVTVVPTFWPITIAPACARSTVPAARAASVVATAALEDCITTVIAAPTATRRRRPPRVASGKLAGPRWSESPAIPAWRVSIPTKMRPNPARASPADASRPRSRSRASAPTPTIGSAAGSTLILRPNTATSQPVLVVPMFAPKIRPTAWGNVSRPALTKPMVVRVVALDDCTSAVMAAPVATERIGPPVNRSRMSFSAAPAAALSPSVSSTMPIRKRPMPPIRFVTMAALPGRS
jgi:hypothetical protein